MSLTIPRSIAYTIKEGATGVPAFAVQRVLNSADIQTAEDAVFGPKTTEKVKELQEFLNLSPEDGVVGPATQQKFVKRRTKREEHQFSLPPRLLLSKVLYESSAYWAAVNWSVPGGVDCGVTQRRVYDEQYGSDTVIRSVFDVRAQINVSAINVRNLYETFIRRAGINGRRELAFRTAVLSHNYPALATRVSYDGISGLSSYYTTPQAWVSNFGLRFPDGTLIRTPLEWGQRYALGNTAHQEPGQAVKLVNEWS